MKPLAVIHNVVNRLPRWAWSVVALFFAGVFVYAARLIQNDFSYVHGAVAVSTCQCPT